MTARRPAGAGAPARRRRAAPTGRAPPAAPSCETTGRRPRRPGARTPSASAATTTSAASSPTFCAIRASPAARSPETCEPSRGAARLDWITRSITSRIPGPAPDAPRRGASPSAGRATRLKKHVRLPVWQATPSWCARIRRVSPSQSAYTASTCWRWPEVSPFCHSARRDRDQKWVSPVARVRSTASAFIHATMRTSPVSASWTTAGTRPFASKRSASEAALTPRPPRGGSAHRAP